MAIKIDISKAYDRVDWRYLEEIMRKFGFNERWIQIMMMCVTSVEYNVAVNNEVVGPIIPERGLRQGCPLSPFLFIICTEGLSALLRQGSKDGWLHGSIAAKGTPTISHLLFADDSFFFCRAEIEEARQMRKLFETYEAASGQSINRTKSGIFFSPNTHEMLKDGLKHILGILARLDTGRYLGVPSIVGGAKRRVLNFLKDRLWKRIQGWKDKPISKGGKEVLVKEVAQSLPQYCMNVFLFPATVIEEIERMINSFWWGTKRNG
ncbi:LINE-1 retrotransposable element ORF2 protein [Linum perenne]